MSCCLFPLRLDDLERAPKVQKFVEVRRPDGTVAKARGERTFYGAFTGSMASFGVGGPAWERDKKDA